MYSLSANGVLCVWECDTDLDALLPYKPLFQDNSEDTDTEEEDEEEEDEEEADRGSESENDEQRASRRSQIARRTRREGCTRYVNELIHKNIIY